MFHFTRNLTQFFLISHRHTPTRNFLVNAMIRILDTFTHLLRLCWPRQPRLNENDDENVDFLLFVRVIFVVKNNIPVHECFFLNTPTRNI